MKIFCVCCLAFLGILESKIIEIQNFEEIISHVREDSIILLDIDVTLLIPKQMLGCDEWFCAQLKKNAAEGMPLDILLDKTVAQWELIRHITEMDIVEPGTKEIVELLQESGNPVMGLTTQGFTLSRKTVHHLHEQQIFLEKSAPAPTIDGAARTDLLMFILLKKGKDLFMTKEFFIDMVFFLPQERIRELLFLLCVKLWGIRLKQLFL